MFVPSQFLHIKIPVQPRECVVKQAEISIFISEQWLKII